MADNESGLFQGWVLPLPGFVCTECGFDYDAFAPDSAAATIRTYGRRYRIPLTRGLRDEDLDALVRTRPHPEQWSALEYACHMRDVLSLHDERIRRVLTEDRPTLLAMGRDKVAVDAEYNAQDPATVAEELDRAAELLAQRFESVPAGAWQRAGVREGMEMTIDWMAHNVVHEGEHHLVDVGRALRTARGR